LSTITPITKQTITYHLKPLNTEKDHDIWHWKSRSWHKNVAG